MNKNWDTRKKNFFFRLIYLKSSDKPKTSGDEGLLMLCQEGELMIFWKII